MEQVIDDRVDDAGATQRTSQGNPDESGVAMTVTFGRAAVSQTEAPASQGATTQGTELVEGPEKQPTHDRAKLSPWISNTLLVNEEPANSKKDPKQLQARAHKSLTQKRRKKILESPQDEAHTW